MPLGLAAHRANEAIWPVHGLQNCLALGFRAILLLKNHLTEAFLKLDRVARYGKYPTIN